MMNVVEGKYVVKGFAYSQVNVDLSVIARLHSLAKTFNVSLMQLARSIDLVQTAKCALIGSVSLQVDVKVHLIAERANHVDRVVVYLLVNAGKM